VSPGFGLWKHLLGYVVWYFHSRLGLK